MIESRGSGYIHCDGEEESFQELLVVEDEQVTIETLLVDDEQVTA